MDVGTVNSDGEMFRRGKSFRAEVSPSAFSVRADETMDDYIYMRNIQR